GILSLTPKKSQVVQVNSSIKGTLEQFRLASQAWLANPFLLNEICAEYIQKGLLKRMDRKDEESANEARVTWTFEFVSKEAAQEWQQKLEANKHKIWTQKDVGIVTTKRSFSIWRLA